MPPPLGTPDDMVHDQVYGMLFVLIVHVDGIPYTYLSCKGGHSSPGWEAGAFWPVFCNADSFSSQLVIWLMQFRSQFKQAISTKPDIGGELGSVGPTPPRGRDKSGPYALNIASLVVFGNSPPITNRSEKPNL